MEFNFLPPGVSDELGDASGLVLNSVPQYSSMRLEEIIFQVICQVSATEPTCSERRLLSCLASIFSDMRTSPPPRQSVEAALMALIRTGTIYFCAGLDDVMEGTSKRVAIRGSRSGRLNPFSSPATETKY
nr:unnamed protein product [Spirometra erinaceieuropaei]